MLDGTSHEWVHEKPNRFKKKIKSEKFCIEKTKILKT
jgi:hypothetical protein